MKITARNYTGQLTELYYDAGAEEPLVRRFYMRGGICFPKSYLRDGVLDIGGYVILAGLDVDTGVLEVLSGRSWLVVENLIRDGAVEHKGLAPWMVKAWGNYWAGSFYFHQEYELAKQWRLQIYRSKWVEPKPHFIEIDWDRVQEPIHTLWRYVRLAKLRFPEDSEVHRRLPELKRHVSKLDDIHPAVHALLCCVAGIERYPYRERKAA